LHQSSPIANNNNKSLITAQLAKVVSCDKRQLERISFDGCSYAGHNRDFMHYIKTLHKITCCPFEILFPCLIHLSHTVCHQFLGCIAKVPSVE
ncbi:13414_t:CDS:2, partial [Entrophospora sp. SA101]